ncbi:hypothetical protein FOMPIDRAFT_1019682 [Fomitopsis schrenkii]|uniref:Uncharacterized protein n=1 Tax=Fomitopsis schrenkii TaxID=2126942 RepID=S8DNN5_FOMSC|nr:hypothetical protein FOMPIDRAFT_1019682 [Fomitopsis schrenkii]
MKARCGFSAGTTRNAMTRLILGQRRERALYNRELEKDDKKMLCQLLGKLHLPETVDEDKARTLKTLMQNIRSRRPLRDTTSQNAFSKLEDALSQKYTPQLEGFSMKGAFEFIDGFELDEEEEDVKPVRRARNHAEKTRCAVKAAVTPVKIEDSDDDEEESEDEDEAEGGGDEDEDGEDRTPMPKRLTQRLPEDTASSRASSVPSTPSPVDFGEDEEEAEEVEDIL